MPWKVLCIVPFAGVLQLFLHELSHMIVGRLHERFQHFRIFPYPHRYRGRLWISRHDCALGRFSLIYYYNHNHLPRHIAPMWLGLAILGVSVTLMAYVRSIENGLWFLPTAAFALWDVLWFWATYLWGSKRSDGKRWRYGDLGGPNDFIQPS